MSKHVDSETMRQMATNIDKYYAFEREVMGSINREIDGRKEKAESARISREKKAKRKRQRAASGLG